MKQIAICFIYRTTNNPLFLSIPSILSHFLIKNIRKSIHLKILFYLSFYPNSLYLKRLFSISVFLRLLICEQYNK